MDPQNIPADEAVPEAPAIGRVPAPAAVAGRAREDDDTLEYWYFCGEGSLLRPD